MRAGRLRHRITLQQPVRTEAADGERVVTYVDVVTVSAEVLSPKGRSYLAAREAHAELTTIVTIRYRSDIQPSWRATFGDRVLEVDHIADLQGRRRYLELHCKESVL